MHASEAWTIAFAGGTLDRAAHLRTDEAAGELPRLGRARAVLVGEGQSVALHGSNALAPAPLPEHGAELALLGTQDGTVLFAADATSSPDAGGRDTRFASLREAAAGLGPADATLAGYAVALVAWQRTHRFCGRCATETVSERAGHRRRCPNCGLRSFPRTDPVVTMVIESGDRALLTRRRGAVGTTWSAVAGFIEPGETPEEALVREAHEEVGVAVARVRYVGAQPWPFPHALMLGYRAIADGDQAPASVATLTSLPAHAGLRARSCAASWRLAPSPCLRRSRSATGSSPTGCSAARARAPDAAPAAPLRCGCAHRACGRRRSCAP